ncbi:MAG TPA: type 1 glutamine amidotransferase domain-containing protein [Anaerolineaceae bacterium]|jgi:protease I|nr:type 1 glutamine amidotransferase domain-containing protein [Anaerolineaceae bacterium]HQP09311.1 type 1 glutamine amidotransferase domain-containing protein [Anaerolineaceae bacterium]
MTQKLILFLVAPEFEDLEFWVPLMRMQEEGHQVIVAGKKAKEVYTGKHGLMAISDMTFDNINPEEFDAVVVPGGWAPDKLRRYDCVKYIVRTMYEQNKIIGLICHAGLVGISAGIVSGHLAVGSEGIKDDLINAGAIWTDKAAFRSKNIVWGRVIADIPHFCKELVAALKD